MTISDYFILSVLGFLICFGGLLGLLVIAFALQCLFHPSTLRKLTRENTNMSLRAILCISIAVDIALELFMILGSIHPFIPLALFFYAWFSFKSKGSALVARAEQFVYGKNYKSKTRQKPPTNNIYNSMRNTTAFAGAATGASHLSDANTSYDSKDFSNLDTFEITAIGATSAGVVSDFFDNGWSESSQNQMGVMGQNFIDSRSEASYMSDVFEPMIQGVNPATGLSMMEGGTDIAGNPFGVDLSAHHDHHDQFGCLDHDVFDHHHHHDHHDVFGDYDHHDHFGNDDHGSHTSFDDHL